MEADTATERPVVPNMTTRALRVPLRLTIRKNLLI